MPNHQVGFFLPANFKVTHCRCHHSPITARVWPPLQQDHITVVTAADEEIDVIYIPEVEWGASKERLFSLARPRTTAEFVVDP